MASTSQVSAFINALHTALAARGGLSGVTVFKYPQAADDLGVEYIVLAVRIESAQTYPAASKRLKDEDVTITGLIYTQTAGKGDAAAATALERAEDLLAEIENEIGDDPTVTNTVRVAQLTDYTHTPGGSDQGRVHQIEFTINYTARLTRS